jgi:threonine/homoserine/homoserine lactone efflux protein
MTLSENKSKYEIIINGFYFGMIIQLAVGPVCLYIFQSGNQRGFEYAELVVLAVALIDALYIILAILGLSIILQGQKTKLFLKFFGAFIVLIFGVNIITSELLTMRIIPAINVFENSMLDNPFYNGLIITASNPLTILFWSGVFSSKVSNDQFSKKNTVYFSIGCIFATLLFLTFIAYLSSLMKSFLPLTIIKYLNITVGLILICFAGTMIIKKNN